MQQVTLPKRTTITNGTDTWTLDTNWFLRHLMLGPQDLIGWFYEFDVICNINGMKFKSSESEQSFDGYDEYFDVIAGQMFDRHCQRYMFDPQGELRPRSPMEQWGQPEEIAEQDFPGMEVHDLRGLPGRALVEAYALGRNWKKVNPHTDIKQLEVFADVPEPYEMEVKRADGTTMVKVDQTVTAIAVKTGGRIYADLFNHTPRVMLDTVYTILLGYAIKAGLVK